jgi:glycosyltransferase involved in cell wall biosynthesis
MNIILATGIYPPDIGGPATYCRALAQELVDLKHDVVVLTYGEKADGRKQMVDADPWSVIRVGKSGGPLLRWWRYSRALKKYGADADIVYAFSSVSCGIPLKIAFLRKPKKILRLGGDFLWERYTDRGGEKGLREWYKTIGDLRLMICHWLLKHFDHIVFSSAFQRDIYLDHYKDLPAYSVIENALPIGATVLHEKHEPLRLLFLGRLVKFKNLSHLLSALQDLPRVTLTIAGSGPELSVLQSLSKKLKIDDRVAFIGNREGKEKQKLFYDHDVLILPSITEISPNVALEAHAVGMPILLTEETGLSAMLQKGMVVRPLSDTRHILAAIKEVQKKYMEIAASAAQPAVVRLWSTVAEEHEELFNRLFSSYIVL